MIFKLTILRDQPETRSAVERTRTMLQSCGCAHRLCQIVARSAARNDVKRQGRNPTPPPFKHRSHAAILVNRAFSAANLSS
jgi:hypothetical protein